MSDSKTLEIAVIKGDGVGTEIMEATIMVLKAVCHKFGHRLKTHPVIACGDSIEIFHDPLPEESLKICQETSAVLFGNTGLKKYQSLPLGERPEAALMRLRKGMTDCI